MSRNRCRIYRSNSTASPASVLLESQPSHTLARRSLQLRGLHLRWDAPVPAAVAALHKQRMRAPQTCTSSRGNAGSTARAPRYSREHRTAPRETACVAHPRVWQVRPHPRVLPAVPSWPHHGSTENRGCHRGALERPGRGSTALRRAS